MNKSKRLVSIGSAVLFLCASLPSVAQRSRRQHVEVCRAQFEVSNVYSAPVDVWAYGDDRWSFLGTSYPGQALRFTHSYIAQRNGEDRCERCAQPTQIQYRVPAGYTDAGAILCIDNLAIDPCNVKRTTFGGPQICGSPRGQR